MLKRISDWGLLWLVFVCVALGFSAGAVWSAQVIPRATTFVTPQELAPVTPATSAPPTVASIQP